MISHSIIKKSQLEGTHRIDAEYYRPEYLEIKDKLSKIKTSPLKEVTIISTGAAYSSEHMGSNFEIPLARIGDVTNKIEVSDWIKLSKEEFEKFKNKKIKNLDIIMTMTGDPPDVGKCNLIKVSDDQILAFNQRVAKLSAKISPYYLFAYLSTEIARLQSERNALGIRQRNVGINDLRNIQVALPYRIDYQAIFDNLVDQHLIELKNANIFYSQAEDLLLQELGLKDFKAEEDLSCIANLSDVKSVHRIDAEYFQPKYEKLIEKIKKYNLKSLGDLASMKKGFEPGSDEYQDNGKLFLRVSSISKNGLIDKDQKYISDELYSKLKNNFEPKKGEILLTKDATPGIAYVLKDLVEGILASGVMRLKLKENIEPEYIALCINSIICQMQIERDAGGSIISHWKPEQIKKLQIPILPKSSHQKIADLVRRSHEARKKAKELLEEAKHKVEEIISKG